MNYFKLAISAFGEEKRIGGELQKAMFSYVKVVKWFGSVLCVVLAILMINKGITLWNIGSGVDGDGIGIYFLGFEINDRVSEQSIPTYAIGFFVGSIITALVPFVLFGKTLVKSRTSS